MVNTANYVRNRSPCGPLANMTPFQAWSGSIPDLSHIGTPGTTCWTINRLHTKLQDDSTECKLLGFEGDHIYRLLHPSGKIIPSSSVHFGKEKRGPGDLTLDEDYDHHFPKKLCKGLSQRLMRGGADLLNGTSLLQTLRTTLNATIGIFLNLRDHEIDLHRRQYQSRPHQIQPSRTVPLLASKIRAPKVPPQLLKHTSQDSEQQKQPLTIH